MRLSARNNLSFSPDQQRLENGDKRVTHRLGIFVLDLPANHHSMVCLENDMTRVLIVPGDNRTRYSGNTGLAIGLDWITGLDDRREYFSAWLTTNENWPSCLVTCSAARLAAWRGQ